MRLCAQLYLIKPESLEATTYYIGVFDMDYYLHEPFHYKLRVRLTSASCC
jgi:hypothetical protein